MGTLWRAISQVRERKFRQDKENKSCILPYGSSWLSIGCFSLKRVDFVIMIFQAEYILSGRVSHIPERNIIVSGYQYPDAVFSHPCNYVPGIWDKITGTGTCDIGKRYKDEKGKERATEDEP